MRFLRRRPIFAVVVVVLSGILRAAGGIVPANVTVGENLEVIANVTLDEAAPPGGLEITLTSSDPSRVLFSRTPEETGAPSIKLRVRADYRGSPDYYVHGFGKSGTVAYTVTAPGRAPGTGTVTLAPSAVVLFRGAMGLTNLMATTGAGKMELLVHSALLDADGNYQHPQPVAGGRRVSVAVSSSNSKVGTVAPAVATIEGGSAVSALEFLPSSAGQTTLSLSVPAGFSAPAQYGSATALVIAPGIAITSDAAIGRNLQIHGAVSLGEPAPAGGVAVTLTSSDPGKLLLSKRPDEAGADCIRIDIPAGGVRGEYYLQALGGAGEVTYMAAAPGFRERTGTITLTPSGLVLGGPQGPPDEAELLNQQIAEGPHGFVASLSAPAPTVVTAYAVQLDPATHRGADLTVQAVRPGVSIPAVLTNSNPSAGSVKTPEMTISGGSSSAVTHFVPAGIGKTVIALNTPEGYTPARNSTSLTVIVKE